MISCLGFSVACDLRFHPRGEAVLLLHLQAARCARQEVGEESLAIFADDKSLPLAFETYEVPESGNRLLRVSLPSIWTGQWIHVGYRAEIASRLWVQDPASVGAVTVGALPFFVQPYLLASRYCQSDLLRDFAEAEFGHLLPGHTRVTAVCNWIREKIKYAEGSSDTRTTAQDTLTTRTGVCRDFAHLAIALCRALDMPTRFVSAYSAGLFPQDFHALFEVYLAGRWYLFDPTRLASVDRAVRIGIGRDAMDVSFATVYGDVETTKPIIRVDMTGGSIDEEPTLQAVSLSDS